MTEFALPTADYKSFNDKEAAKSFIDRYCADIMFFVVSDSMCSF